MPDFMRSIMFDATSGRSVAFDDAGLETPSGREGRVPKLSTPVFSLRPVPTRRLERPVSLPKLSGSMFGLLRNGSGATASSLGAVPPVGSPSIRAALPASIDALEASFD